jgi:hypothetical protein
MKPLKALLAKPQVTTEDIAVCRWPSPQTLFESLLLNAQIITPCFPSTLNHPCAPAPTVRLPSSPCDDTTRPVHGPPGAQAAFAVFDKAGKGLTIDEMRAILSNFGDQMSPEECDEYLALIEVFAVLWACVRQHICLLVLTRIEQETAPKYLVPHMLSCSRTQEKCCFGQTGKAKLVAADALSELVLPADDEA